MKSTLYIIAIFYISIALASPNVEIIGYYNENIEDDRESLYDVYHSMNGGYYACGVSNGQTWILKLRENTETVWSRQYSQGSLYSLIETDDGEILAGGRIENLFGVILIDSEGEVLWDSAYFSGSCESVIELKSGEFALGGSQESAPVVLLVDNSGGVIWETRLRDYLENGGRVRGMRETEGGIVAGGTIGQGPGLLEAGLFFKLDFNGNVEWQQVYDNPRGDGIFSVASRANGGFALLAKRSGNRENDWWNETAFSLILTDSDGNLQSQDHYPSGRGVTDMPLTISRMSDGGFIMSGMSMALRSPWGNYPILIRVNSNGEFQWRQRFTEYVEQGPQINTIYRSLNSVIVQDHDRIVAVGAMYHEDDGSSVDGWLVRLFPDQPGPFLFYKSPEDSVLTVLSGDSIQFIVRARNRDDIEITYEWELDDEIIAEDTTVTIQFVDSGEFPVRCLVQDRDGEFIVTWHVTVTDLYVSAFTPDTLDLAIRRGTSVDFSLDTIRYTDGAEPEILWTKTNLINGQSEDAGRDASVTIDFPWSGEYSVEGRVSRGESSDAVTWHVLVKGAIWAYVPVGDSLEVLPDSVVHFEVVPSAPEDESLEVQWLVDGELVREGELALDWAFRRVENPPYWSRVQCIVADSVEADTVQWLVTVNDLSVGDTKEVGRVRSPVLLSVSPNPFNSTLTIRYATGGLETAATRLGIYDIAGREVFSTVSPPRLTVPSKGVDRGGSTLETLIWDASAAPAGVYFVRLQAGGAVNTKKVVLMR